ncbi:MAG: hypothetical protein KDD76_00120, partial [Rickettsiales bacterium]|nr:hypothetical protein [Rickettsiales bacterium]
MVDASTLFPPQESFLDSLNTAIENLRNLPDGTSATNMRAQFEAWESIAKLISSIQHVTENFDQVPVEQQAHYFEKLAEASSRVQQWFLTQAENFAPERGWGYFYSKQPVTKELLENTAHHFREALWPELEGITPTHTPIEHKPLRLATEPGAGILFTSDSNRETILGDVNKINTFFAGLSEHIKDIRPYTRQRYEDLVGHIEDQMLYAEYTAGGFGVVQAVPTPWTRAIGTAGVVGSYGYWAYNVFQHPDYSTEEAISKLAIRVAGEGVMAAKFGMGWNPSFFKGMAYGIAPYLLSEGVGYSVEAYQEESHKQNLLWASDNELSPEERASKTSLQNVLTNNANQVSRNNGFLEEIVIHTSIQPEMQSALAVLESDNATHGTIKSYYTNRKLDPFLIDYDAIFDLGMGEKPVTSIVIDPKRNYHASNEWDLLVVLGKYHQTASILPPTNNYRETFSQVLGLLFKSRDAFGNYIERVNVNDISNLLHKNGVENYEFVSQALHATDNNARLKLLESAGVKEQEHLDNIMGFLNTYGMKSEMSDTDSLRLGAVNLIVKYQALSELRRKGATPDEENRPPFKPLYAQNIVADFYYSLAGLNSLDQEKYQQLNEFSRHILGATHWRDEQTLAEKLQHIPRGSTQTRVEKLASEIRNDATKNIRYFSFVPSDDGEPVLTPLTEKTFLEINQTSHEILLTNTLNTTMSVISATNPTREKNSKLLTLLNALAMQHTLDNASAQTQIIFENSAYNILLDNNLQISGYYDKPEMNVLGLPQRINISPLTFLTESIGMKSEANAAGSKPESTDQFAARDATATPFDHVMMAQSSNSWQNIWSPEDLKTHHVSTDNSKIVFSTEKKNDTPPAATFTNLIPSLINNLDRIDLSAKVINLHYKEIHNELSELSHGVTFHTESLETFYIP